MKIRYANIKDSNFILRLHNQNVLRGNFFSKKKTILKDHKIWFANKIKEKMLFVCLLKNKIGYIRFDYIDKKNLSVSVAIKDKFKRKGYGRLMLIKTLKKVTISKFNIIAIIKNKNLASRKFFLTLGFKPVKKNIYMIRRRHE